MKPTHTCARNYASHDCWPLHLKAQVLCASYHSLQLEEAGLQGQQQEQEQEQTQQALLQALPVGLP